MIGSSPLPFIMGPPFHPPPRSACFTDVSRRLPSALPSCEEAEWTNQEGDWRERAAVVVLIYCSAASEVIFHVLSRLSRDSQSVVLPITTAPRAILALHHSHGALEQSASALVALWSGRKENGRLCGAKVGDACLPQNGSADLGDVGPGKPIQTGPGPAAPAVCKVEVVMSDDEKTGMMQTRFTSWRPQCELKSLTTSSEAAVRLRSRNSIFATFVAA